ncbi:beta-ketoacyl-ACP synthase II [Actinospica sp. MGRD01-02]|uniref:3-oxoacyl-[acyl-carrier-protein] synthase 2 n=1 Tax=Actinospica acidithermotolerans TaxID=2828514 RepID=A0A941EB75_9ACTN|nr:beta-ketoacyl-ACP synthase II [Actinospica acidithermotolerans]MBR7829595.1 beta-ketoacyl-ACP synthase II [Actinospica acidithermotolerans]
MDKTVVVTGLGATTPLGGDVASTWEALLAGQSGIVPLTEEWAADMPVRMAGRVQVEPAEVMKPVERRRLDRSAQFALIAAREAWKDAGLDGVEVDVHRLGVAVGSGIGGVTTLLDNYDLLLAKGPRGVSPRAVPMLMPNSPAAYVGLEFGALAGVHTPVSACATGCEAIGYALNMIRSGRADVVVCGGTEAAIHPLPISAFANMMAMSKNNEDPKRASRPYDKGRDGFVLGEGSGIVVLESEEHAAARGARVYAVLAGVGYSADSHDIAQPDPTGEGIAAAVRSAVADAGISPEQIVHLNAHATSTPLGDTGELKALRMALGEDAEHIAISATKSMTGHLLGGAGGIETVFAVKAVHELLAPPTINITDLDENADLDIVRDEPRALPAETPAGPIVALNNSFGFGGHNVVLAIRRA